MPGNKYEVLIIGGGPGGTAAATYLAKAGRTVLLLEKEFFPRFHIGESLLPYNRRLFDEMGLTPILEKHGFPKKYGAQFHLGNGTKSTYFVFRKGRFTREIESYQVERATFDHLLLKHARQCGAEVHEGWTVERFSSGKDMVTVEASDPDGQARQFQAEFLLDASGRSNLTGNQERMRQIHPDLKKIAIFGHFRNVRIDAGERSGDTVIVRLKDKWFWLIPLAADKVSIGCVLDQAEFVRSGETPSEIFFRICKSTPVMRDRMEHAKLCGPLQATSDFSYYNKRLVGRRLIRIGDAAGFMDPIFSAGVFLAMTTGKWAAETVIKALQRGNDGERGLRKYERRAKTALETYWEMVRNFYTIPFLEVFFEPRERFNLASTVNAVLAGELERRWSLRWRMRLFFWLVRRQAQRPFLPRLNVE